MIIKQAIIRGFGKFVDKTFDFSEGLTVIEGENEAGKSTLHAFIEGILYGFLDPTKKRKTYFDAYTRYRPMGTQLYGGALLIERNNIVYRIDRNLDKTHHEVTISEAATGKIITDTLDIDPTSKLPDVAAWLAMPYFMYKNTLSVSQMALKPTASGVGFVEALSNIGTSGGGFNADKARDYLKKQLDTIGSLQARTKPYKIALDEHKALEAKRAHTKAVLEHVKTMRETRENHADEKAQLLDKLETIDAQIARVDNTIRRHRYDTVQGLFEKKAALKNTLDKTEYAKDYDEKILEKVSALSNAIESSKQAIQSAEESIQLLGETTVDDALKPHTIKQCDEDAQRREDYEASKTKGEYAKMRVSTLRWVFLALTILALVGLGIIIGFLNFMPYGIIPSVLGAIFLGLMVRMMVHLREARDHLNQIRVDIRALHTRYGMAEDASYQAFSNAISTIRASLKHAEENAEKITDYKGKIVKEEARQVDNIAKRQTLLKTYNVRDEIALQTLHEAHRLYKATQKERHYVTVRINDLLEGVSFETFRESIDFNAPLEDDSIRPALFEKRESVAEALQKCDTEINRLDGAIERDENTVDSLETIDAKLITSSQKIESMETQREKLEGALKLLNKAMDAIERTLAPELNEAVNRIMQVCTNNRYDTIKMLRDFSFKVDVDHTEQSAAYFSHGTRDQIHFSMRMGMLDALGLSHAPILLDEVFASSDDTRLAKILSWLQPLAKSRQILLFTAHKREHEALKTMALKHSHITIS